MLGQWVEIQEEIKSDNFSQLSKSQINLLFTCKKKNQNSTNAKEKITGFRKHPASTGGDLVSERWGQARSVQRRYQAQRKGARPQVGESWGTSVGPAGEGTAEAACRPGGSKEKPR